MESVLATIINFSSNEARFLSQCIEEIEPVSAQIIVPICDHFFDGTPEDHNLLGQIYRSHPEVEFIQYPFSTKGVYANHGPVHWHNLSRLIGVHHLRNEITHVLFLDVDEIMDGERFAKWFNTGALHAHDGHRLGVYWYFREPIYRATTWEPSPLIAVKEHLSYDAIMHPLEREGTFSLLPNTPNTLTLGVDKKPLTHHYSWVRSRDEMLKKVLRWGHRSERNWTKLVNQEFATPFSGCDFVHGYSFETVSSKLKERNDYQIPKETKQVLILSHQKIIEIDLHYKFHL